MIHFHEWTWVEAHIYSAKYAAAQPIRLSWLRRELEAQGYEPSAMVPVEQLQALWDWATRQFDTPNLTLMTSQPADDPQPGDRPPWYAQTTPWVRMSDGALWLIELLGAHLADLVMARLPESRWGVYRVPARLNDMKQHSTVLFLSAEDAGVNPAQMVYGPVIGHLHHGRLWSDEHSLNDLYEYCLERATH